MEAIGWFVVVLVVGLILIMAVGGWYEGRVERRFRRSSEELSRLARARGMTVSDELVVLRRHGYYSEWDGHPTPRMASIVSDRFLRFWVDRDPSWEQYGGGDFATSVANGDWDGLESILFTYQAFIDGTRRDLALVGVFPLPHPVAPFVLSPARPPLGLSEEDVRQRGLENVDLSPAWGRARCLAADPSSVAPLLSDHLASSIAPHGGLRHWVETEGGDLLLSVSTKDPAEEVAALVAVAHQVIETQVH